ncbi:MAG TPA: hypothetical protein VGB17_15615 [Pyrinomonadaceae bacterium]|jgi:hypothetical protein
MEVIERISLREVEESGQPTIYYAVNTCWWTHDPAHLSRTPPATEAEILRTAENFRLNAQRPDAPLDEFLERARRAHEHRLPCDPRGSVLMMGDLNGFLAAARNSREHYGKHGLRAFMAAHHLNCVLSLKDRLSWSETTWEAYNDALDRLDIRKQEAQKREECRARRLAEMPPDVLKRAIAFIRSELPEEVKEDIRRLHAEYGEDWIGEMSVLELPGGKGRIPRGHFEWGMRVRNALRNHGLSDDLLLNLNWDDYYVQVVEIAVGLRPNPLEEKH